MGENRSYIRICALAEHILSILIMVNFVSGYGPLHNGERQLLEPMLKVCHDILKQIMQFHTNLLFFLLIFSHIDRTICEISRRS